jgi:hypothetical protein
MHQIVRAEPLKHYHLKVRFSDGLEGVVDLSDLVGKGVFSVWKDPKKFSQVFVDPECHTVCWPGGIDLAPDALYEDIQKQRRNTKAA